MTHIDELVMAAKGFQYAGMVPCVTASNTLSFCEQHWGSWSSVIPPSSYFSDEKGTGGRSPLTTEKVMLWITVPALTKTMQDMGREYVFIISLLLQAFLCCSTQTSELTFVSSLQSRMPHNPIFLGGGEGGQFVSFNSKICFVPIFHQLATHKPQCNPDFFMYQQSICHYAGRKSLSPKQY